MINNPLLTIKEELSDQSDSIINNIFRDSETGYSEQSSEAAFQSYDSSYAYRKAKEQEDEEKMNISIKQICCCIFIFFVFLASLSMLLILNYYGYIKI